MADWNDDNEAKKRAWEAHRKSIEVLFANENFFIGMLQVVSGGAVLAALSQADRLFRPGLGCASALFVTVMVGGLVSALFAGYFKHQYKMWDVKAGSSEQNGRLAERLERRGRAKFYLDAMRATMLISVVAIVLALGILVLLVWLYTLDPRITLLGSPS